MRILLIFLTLTFATELEVDGNLKVTGNVDVQNNPIKNVGIPTDMNDAINAEVLQSALRDDGVFEYKSILFLCTFWLNAGRLQHGEVMFWRPKTQFNVVPLFLRPTTKKSFWA